MTNDTTLASESEQGDVNGLRAFLRRPIAFLGVIALTALGVVTLGTLYNADDTTSVAASHVASAPGSSDALTDGKLTV
jgi:hypothetical protein